MVAGIAFGGVALELSRRTEPALFDILLTLIPPRGLPGPVDAAVASTAMHADSWNAGIALMNSASPEGWRGLVNANTLMRVNQDALNPCAATAAKLKKPQSCTINVPIPE